MNRLISLSGVCLAFGVSNLLFACTAGAATVPNPGFEADGAAFENGVGYAGLNGNPEQITGWTKGGDKFAAFGDRELVGVSSGTQMVAVGTTVPEMTHVGFLQVYQDTVHTTTLSTVISGLTPSSQYSLTYREDARADTSAVQDASVTLDGTPLIASHAVASTTAFGTTSAQFTAAAETQTLTFINHQTDGRDATLLIDAIQIVAVPEPTSLSLIGVAALALVRQRR